ncbi:MAG: methylated-DNA--[protein]-cysteine S-methyltransferase [Burkholderiaceae bacterium]|jgi:methylated-DNA-[protein]-cysteine S-methyltransferase|nr:methylated-DNA--[protein]-cysteine S-methyltransferase [Burkholderiaceae bacterium]
MKLPPLLYTTCTDTPLGSTRLAATGTALAGVWFVEGQRDTPDAQTLRGWVQSRQHPILREAAAQLASYFAGQRTSFELPLDLSYGSAFQQAVWRALLDIPLGDTLTYGTLAQRIGRPAAVRAVGTAVGANPISVIVPCHRVLGANGALTGYGGGLDRKQRLLKLEGCSSMRVK